MCTTHTPSATPRTIEDTSPSDAGVYPSEGVSVEFCCTNENCAESRTCLFAGVNPFVSCNETTPSSICRYFERIECSLSTDCSRGERCYIQTDTDDVISNLCSSCHLEVLNNVEPIDIEQTSCEEVWLGNYTDDSCSIFYRGCASKRTFVEFLDDGAHIDCLGGAKP